ncbi:MAG: hypothetical protein ACM3S0_09080 [Acidobacteriota bacterium]
MSNPVRVRVGGLMVALLFLALSGAFLVWHLAFPSDGARLEPGEPAWTSNGLAVTPLIEMANGLRRGDVVIEVDGRSMETWAQAIFQWGAARPMQTSNQPLVYAVMRNGQRVALNAPSMPYPLDAILVKNWSTLLFTFFSQFVMTCVFLIKPNDRAARALFLWAWSLSHTYTWALGLQMSDLLNGVGYWLYQMSASGLWLVYWGANLEFAMVFPRPSPILQRRPWTRRLIYFSPFAIFFAYLAVSRAITPTMLTWLGRWMIGNWLVAFIFLSLSAYFVWDGYRSSQDPADRRKVRWLIFAFVLCGGIGLCLWFIPGIILGQPLIDANALGLSLLPFPVILAIAVLRYQLFDIDIIIRRTLIYGVLTALLAFLYFGSILSLGQVSSALTGAQQPEIVTSVSTLAIAALFTPLRQRVQNAIDRRFFRHKYDATQVLAAFSATVRDEVELEKLAERLLAVVDETMQPTRVSLWMKRVEGKEKRLL